MTLIYNLSFNSMLYCNKNVAITVSRANSHPSLNQGIKSITSQDLFPNYSLKTTEKLLKTFLQASDKLLTNSRYLQPPKVSS